MYLYPVLMQQLISGAFHRIHGPLTLRACDRVVSGCGIVLGGLGAALVYSREFESGIAASAGSAVILWLTARERRRQELTVWMLAAADSDPVLTLALYEHLYGLRLGDLRVVANWQEAYDDLDAPPEVRAVWEFLHPDRRGE